MVNTNQTKEEKSPRDLGAYLNDILDSVKSSYGEKMFRILYKRIEKTLDDFDHDVMALLSDIENKDSHYFEKLPDIKSKSKIIADFKKTEPVTEPKIETQDELDTGGDQQIIERLEKKKR
jgi:hypothetical protein